MIPTDPRMIPLMRKAHRELTVPCLTKVKTMRHAPNICNNKLETRSSEENGRCCVLLCCFVLFCVVLCCFVLFCVVLCCVVLCCVVLCCVVYEG